MAFPHKLVAFRELTIPYSYWIGGFLMLLNYKELSKELKISIRYIQRCIQEEGLPCIYFGRAVRFDPIKVAEWVNSRSQKSNNPEVTEVA
jgi:excisionase family DNA binding protein